MSQVPVELMEAHISVNVRPTSLDVSCRIGNSSCVGQLFSLDVLPALSRAACLPQLNANVSVFEIDGAVLVGYSSMNV